MALTSKRKKELAKKGITFRKTKNALQIAVNVDPEDAIKYFDTIEQFKEMERKRTKKVDCIPEKMAAELTFIMEMLRTRLKKEGKKSRILTDKKIHRYNQMIAKRTCPARKKKR